MRGTDAVPAARRARRRPTIVFQYSPESFHHTELDYALEICEAVAAEWGPTPDDEDDRQPADDGRAVPAERLRRPDRVVRRATSRGATRASSRVHPHNDRGTAVATAELGLMAGAERVEGTLFGNGERTGNVDIVTLALNLLTQGVDPKLDFSQHRRDAARSSRSATSCRCIRAIRGRASSSTRRSPARTRTRSRRGCTRGSSSGGRAVGRAVPADRPEGRRAQLRGDHPRQLAVGQGRRRLPPARRTTASTCRAGCRSSSPSGAGDHRRSRAASCRRPSSSRCSASTTSSRQRRTSCSRYTPRGERGGRPIARATSARRRGDV